MKKRISVLLSMVMIFSLLFSSAAMAEEAAQPPAVEQTASEQQPAEQPAPEQPVSEPAPVPESPDVDSEVTETPADTTPVDTQQPLSDLETTLPAEDLVPDAADTTLPEPLEGSWEDVTELAEQVDEELAGAKPAIKLHALIMAFKGTKGWDAPHLVAVSGKITLATKNHLPYINTHLKAKRAIVLLTDETVRLARKYVQRDMVQNIVYRNAVHTYAMLGMYKRAAAVKELALRNSTNRPADMNDLKKLYQKADQRGLKVFVKGKRPNFDVQPQLVNGRTMVPLRAISESMGAKVNYDAKNQQVTIINGNVNVNLPINSKQAIVNGKRVNLDQPAASIKGRTMVPLRFVSENLGAKVNYDSQSEIISVE